MNNRKWVLLVNPPTSSPSVDYSAGGGANRRRYIGRATLPNLGLHSLASYLEAHTNFQSIYFDCDACPPHEVGKFIDDNHHDIFAVCVSALTHNFGAGMQLCDYVKKRDSKIMTLCGNDHFSTFAELIMKKYEKLIDFGFAGNGVYEPMSRFLRDAGNDSFAHRQAYPGLVYRNGNVHRVDGARGQVGMDVNYEILDRAFKHSEVYDNNFQRILGKQLGALLGRELRKECCVEIACGCIKFITKNACSFCSIYHNGLWGGRVDTAERAWQIIESAVTAGYDYIFITADELPLTFPGLLHQMAKKRPAWHKALPEMNRPVLACYARADGMQKSNVVEDMREIGIRIVYVGIDAADPLSLLATNKPLINTMEHAERLFEANQQAAQVAADNDMFLMAGMVVGHIGETPEQLDKNVKCVCNLITENSNTFASIEISPLFPLPGSMDHKWLTRPQEAAAFAHAYGLEIAGLPVRSQIAEKYNNYLFEGGATREGCEDYREALMPAMPAEALQAAQRRIARCAMNHRVLPVFDY